MVLLGRFALEGEYSSSMAKALKAVADWIGSLEMERGSSPLFGRSEATCSLLERTLCLPRHALLGVFLQHPSHSPRKSQAGRTSPHMPPVFSTGGNQAPNFSKVKIKAAQKCRRTGRW